MPVGRASTCAPTKAYLNVWCANACMLRQSPRPPVLLKYARACRVGASNAHTDKRTMSMLAVGMPSSLDPRPKPWITGETSRTGSSPLGGAVIVAMSSVVPLLLFVAVVPFVLG